MYCNNFLMLILFFMGIWVMCTHTPSIKTYPSYPMNEGYSSFAPLGNGVGTMYDEEGTQTADKLVGMIYPPRAGALHTNAEFPFKKECQKRSFVAIYEDEPFLRYYNKELNMC